MLLTVLPQIALVPSGSSICLMRVHSEVEARLNAYLISWLPTLPRSHRLTSMKDLSGCVSIFLFIYFFYTSIDQNLIFPICCKHLKREQKESTSFTSQLTLFILLPWRWSKRWVQSEWDMVKI